MNKQTCDKIKFMLWGLISRIKENRDFIKSINFKFKSGLKVYEGEYEAEESILNFNGRNVKLEVDEVPDFIAGEALNYESLEFILEERGRATILNADNKNVKTRQVDRVDEEMSDHVTSTSKILKREYYVKVGEANELLKEIGILTKDGKIKNDMIRKYNQIDHFVELIDSMIDEISDVDTINILDCACGKSYLTFVLNYYIKEKKKKNCYFIGIDRSKNVIDASRKMARNLGYRNMEFIEGDLNEYKPDRRIDIVISLHACDIATDMALGQAVRVNARAIMCVPCCHRELLSQYRFDELQPILKHGILRARFADLLTDGIRSLLLETQGYRVSVVEYISPLETPKNILIRAVKVADKNHKAIEEYKRLKETLNINPYLERYMNI
ncbi:class I SAM-dependent methyltransferase [Fonticella tunisiensis]|uniref:Methyltransferase family protein n=1 Tax=Fonticella tunisiensis TaxID=1096341 RepID=A0A4V3ETY8_9CLOT|nr:SAM-dependent methyltransferase [Fonticella tunisiensis]TDT60917.1 methyltransferase family protein [Fonticella tunisiensis]